MKELSLERMERTSGGDALDAACGIGTTVAAALSVRALVGAAVVVPVYGQILLGGLTVACAGRFFYMW